MNKLFAFTLTFLMATLMALPAHAQLFKPDDDPNPRKVRRELQREERDLLQKIKQKPEREARKEAKRLRKDGFTVFPGSLPIEKQLQQIWMRRYMTNDDGSARYIFADGNGVGKTQTAAEMQAMEAAKLQLAGQISNEVNQIIEAKIANDQLTRETGNSLTKFVAGSKNYIIQQLAFVKPGFKIYRNVGKQDMEVAVILYYNVEEALIAAQAALEARIRADLEDEADVLIEELNNLFRPENQ
ncbi:MAG: hypothetical protein D6722_15975 [Bacteroidetes bacterium]|nr:MAG: hypothetical protein D6722_15975 [Bacteroidota bacterium]